MSTNSPPSRSSAIAAILLFAAAGYLYFLLISIVAGSQAGDAADRGLDTVYSLLLVVVLWAVLVALLVVGARGMPSWSALPAFALVPLSAFVTLVAGSLYARHGGWWIMVPAVLPPMIALYALWSRFLPFHKARADWSGAIAWGAILIVTAGSLAMFWVDSLENPAREAKQRQMVERVQREIEETRQSEIGKFEALGPHSSLRDYLQYIPPGNMRHREALEGARRVTSRQADAVALLNEGRFRDLQDLWQLDLAVTPELCRAFGGVLRGQAARIDASVSDHMLQAIELERQLPNLKWLTAQRCDLGEALTLVEDRIKAASDEPRMKELVAALAALHPAR